MRAFFAVIVNEKRFVVASFCKRLLNYTLGASVCHITLCSNVTTVARVMMLIT